MRPDGSQPFGEAHALLVTGFGEATLNSINGWDGGDNVPAYFQDCFLSVDHDEVRKKSSEEEARRDNVVTSNLPPGDAATTPQDDADNDGKSSEARALTRTEVRALAREIPWREVLARDEVN